MELTFEEIEKTSRAIQAVWGDPIGDVAVDARHRHREWDDALAGLNVREGELWLAFRLWLLEFVEGPYPRPSDLAQVISSERLRRKKDRLYAIWEMGGDIDEDH
jgi:hypothetical protein